VVSFASRQIYLQENQPRLLLHTRLGETQSRSESRKIVGSIPDKLTVFFLTLPNPLSRDYISFNSHSGWGGWSPNWAHSARRPILAYCTCPGDCEDGEFGGIKTGRGSRSIRGKILPQRHFVHHKYHLARPGREPRTPRWEASD
jgi:hypothetical protein